VLERRVEVDVVRNVERQVQGHSRERHAWAFVGARSSERFVPRRAAERHQCIERGLRIDVAERRKVDDDVAVAPTDSRTAAGG
jgi:hypothetical protein